ncbi:MAG: pyridoxamine 5'-phosphate oxidase family protein [Bacillus sp. (in: firmicutes)]
MANLVERALVKPLFQLLQQERLVTLTTVDPETKAPNVHAISWIYAKNESTLVFAVSNQSKMVENIRLLKHIVITAIVNESIYSISGEATIKNERIDGITLKLALIELAITEVRDIMFYGSRISVEPQYSKTYDTVAAEKLDQQVMEALRKA